MLSLKNNKPTYILFALIFVLAFCLRLAGLSQRPMHGDEAINAFKLVELLETGIFKYNPQEYHGPTLYYFSIPLTFIFQRTSLQELNEFVLRLLPVLFGMGLFGLLFLFRKTLKKNALIFSSLVLAISPAFVFYSRYYIHEMLFVFFTYALILSIYWFIKKPSYLGVFFFSISLGLWLATKETWIIVFAAMLISFTILCMNKLFRQRISISLKNIKKGQWMLVCALFVLILSTVFSSFFQHMQGLSDFFSSFLLYLKKGSVEQQHIYPVYKYLEWFVEPLGMSMFGESLILIFALIGCLSIFRDSKRKSIIYFLALFSIFSFVLYSIIPYKTPWNILTSWFGFIILAGYGFSKISELIVSKNQRILFYIVSLFFLVHLFKLSYSVNYVHYDSPSNPYTFSQPQKEVLEIEAQFENLALGLENSYDQYIEVISTENDYWPLPWYLRKFKKIAWRNSVDFSSKSADIAIVNIDLENDYIKKLYEYPPPGKRYLYIPLFPKEISVRPGLIMNAYIKNSLWDSLQSKQDLNIDGK